MSQALERKITTGYAVALGFLLVLGSSAWWSVTQFRDTFQWVDHTRKVLYQLEASLVGLLVIQSNSRGYALTANEGLLRTYASDEAALRRTLARLRGLIADNPTQLARLDQLDPLMARAIDLQRERIAARQTDGLQGVIQSRPNVTGGPLMDHIRQIVAEMEAEERDLLEARSTEAQDQARQSIAITLCGGFAALALVSAAGLIVRRDFRHRVQAEAERDRFFNLSIDLLCISSADGYFKRVSPGITDILGWSPAEFMARPYLELIHPDDHAATLREVERQIVSGEKVLQFENRYRHRDGSWRVLSWRSVPQPDGLMYATARDVTELKHTEKHIRQLNTDLQQRADQLEAANQELESFSYSVSHDLRAPLRHIDGFAGLLRKNSAAALDDQGRRHLTTISASARQMGRLIDDLLNFSRMGRTQLQPMEVDQDAVVAAVIRDSGFDRGDRTIAWEIAPLPRVRADHTLLRQVWVNLLENAVKYTGKVAQPRITVGHQLDPDTCEQVFFVRDNGAGFDMRYVDKLFGVFQRLHGPSEFEGTGIGLANVRRIITRHGGRTWAEAAVGAGATFYFSLPATPAVS